MKQVGEPRNPVVAKLAPCAAWMKTQRNVAMLSKCEIQFRHLGLTIEVTGGK